MEKGNLEQYMLETEINEEMAQDFLKQLGKYIRKYLLKLLMLYSRRFFIYD